MSVQCAVNVSKKFVMILFSVVPAHGCGPSQTFAYHLDLATLPVFPAPVRHIEEHALQLHSEKERALRTVCILTMLKACMYYHTR